MLYIILILLLAYKIHQLSIRLDKRDRLPDSQINSLLNRICDLKARVASFEVQECQYKIHNEKVLREIKNEIKSTKLIINRIKI